MSGVITCHIVAYLLKAKARCQAMQQQRGSATVVTPLNNETILNFGAAKARTPPIKHNKIHT
jgi:hypothetical protein